MGLKLGRTINTTGGMMRKTTLSALAVIFSAGSASAAMPDQAPWYVSLSGDLTWITDTDVEGGAGGDVEFDMGGGADVALGFSVLNSDSTPTGLRTELELGYHSADVDGADGALRFGTIMANVYYDVPTTYYGFSPFIGVGIGDAQVYFSRSAGLGNTDTSDNTLAYQGIVGVSYTPQTMPSTDFLISYRYLGLYEPEFDNVEFDSIHTNSLEIGLRYHF